MRGLPTNAYCEGSLVPVSAGYDWHFSVGVRARTFEYLMTMAMLGGVEFV